MSSIRSAIKNPGFRKYAFNSSWLFSEKILRILSELFVGVWVARFLGPETFGVYSFAIAFVVIFGVIAKLGMDQLLVKEFVNQPHNASKLMGTSFVLKNLGALFSILTIIIITFNFINDSQSRFVITILSISLIFESFNIIESFFHAKVNGRLISIAKMVQTCISAVLKIALILFYADLIWFIWVLVLDKLTLGITMHMMMKKKYSSIKLIGNFDFRLAKNLLLDSFPFIITGMAIMGYMRIDQVMIKGLLDEEQLGYYSAAIKLSESWYFVPTIISTSLFPAILNSKKNNQRVYEERMQSLFDLLTVISILASLVVLFFSKKIITLLFGVEYIEAASVLKITIWAGIFVSYGLARGKWVLAEGLQRYSPIIIISGLIVNIVLNFQLIPVYGIVGAAYSTLLAQMNVAIFTPLFIKHYRPSVKWILKSMVFISIILKLTKK